MLSTTQAAALAGTSRSTIERAIKDGEIEAEKTGRYWGIREDEAKRWAAQYEPYAALRKPAKTTTPPPVETAAAPDEAGSVPSKP